MILKTTHDITQYLQATGNSLLSETSLDTGDIAVLPHCSTATSLHHNITALGLPYLPNLLFVQ